MVLEDWTDMELEMQIYVDTLALATTIFIAQLRRKHTTVDQSYALTLIMQIWLKTYAQLVDVTVDIAKET